MKHDNYEILNLIGYGLSKFDNDFINEFGFKSKLSFFQYLVENKIAQTTSVIKNRMDLFDCFFDNARKGWWQKGNAYIHRKILIDSLYGHENAQGYANIIKLYLMENFQFTNLVVKDSPIIKSGFKKLQETGMQAELFFMNNYQSIGLFKLCKLFDARYFGDGYDFMLENENNNLFLIEVKGIREKNGSIRMTENEYDKALEYKEKFILTIVANLNDKPNMIIFENPIAQLNFEKKEIFPKKIITEYHFKI